MHKQGKTSALFVIVAAALVLSLACGGSGTASPTSLPEAVQDPEETAAELPQQDQEEPSEEVPQPTNTSQPTEVPPAATAEPMGMGRSNPYPMSEVVAAPNWEIQVLEVMRGEEAWQAIQTANQFNEPAAEGLEYLLVRLRAKCLYEDSDEHMIGSSDVRVTGDRLTQYSAGGVVAPEPPLDAQLYKDGETEGWVAFSIGQGEGNLILIFDELLNFDDDRRRFIALDEGASLSVSADLAKIEPTDLGKERGAPAPFGETVVTENWRVTLLAMVRGDEAWAMVQEANSFNDPPAEGMEYVAVKMLAGYIGTDDRPTQIDGTYLHATGSANVVYDNPSVVDPDPALDVTLFPGGTAEGWVVLQVAQGETGIMAVFEPLFSLSGADKRFLSLEP